MNNSVVLIAYEINAQTAKSILQKRAGFAAKFKKFQVSNIVDHVAACWEQLEQLFVQEDARIEDRVLYTAKLSDPLRIGKVRNDILNNSFLMSVLVDDTQFGREARAGARYYQFKTNSDFEKKQFSLMLEEAKDRFEHQEVGIFGWVSISEEHVDGALKTVASKFSNLNDGELHFIEFTQAGDIFPNFSNVSSQKFEGKLAGNYSLTLKRDEYESGIQRINEITSTVTRKSAIPVVSIPSENSQVQAPQEVTETMSENTSNKKNTYSDDFKKEVAEAAQLPGATLASVGEQFGVSPTLVRNWKIKFSEEVETPTRSEEKQPKIESKSIQSWLQKSVVEGTIDSDGDLYVSLETSSEETTQEPTKLFITGTQKLASGSKNETSEMSDQITTNETNWLRSDFLKGVCRENAQFSYNLNCDVYGCAERVVVPTKLKKGKVSECPITAGQIGISELNFVFEDGDFRAEGTITGPNGFVYAAEVLTEEPEEGHVPAVNKTADDENSAEMYEFLWDVKKGDTVFVVLCAFERLDGKLSCGFTGEAQVEEPISYDNDDDDDGYDFGEPEVEDVETNDGDIGLFEFQIKRGLVDEDQIEDEDVQNLVEELKQLCEDENFEEASNLLLSNLSFEFGPDELDDDPERFFATTDYIEFECSSENTSVKIGYDESLIVTISVQFEIPLNGGISTAELAEYLPESGAWASASASPGWGYSGSDGDNVWFVGLKGADGYADVNKAFEYDQIHHVSVIQVSSDADWPEAEPISAKNLTLLVNSKTEKTAYYIGDQMTDGPYEADHFFEAIPDYVSAVSEELKGRLPIPNEHLSSTKELFIGMLQDDLDDFNFETDLNAELENFEDTDLSQRMGEIGFRSLSLHHCSFTINDGQLIYGGDTITNEGELFEELEQGEGKYCFINAAKPSEEIFPFEDYKTATAIKFVQFVQSLPDDTFSAVAKYATDGLDLVENNGDLSEAKDDAKLISIANDDGEPFENADAYLECLIQNITDEIEMNGLEISDRPHAGSEPQNINSRDIRQRKEPVNSDTLYEYQKHAEDVGNIDDLKCIIETASSVVANLEKQHDLSIEDSDRLDSSKKYLKDAIQILACNDWDQLESTLHASETDILEILSDDAYEAGFDDVIDFVKSTHHELPSFKLEIVPNYCLYNAAYEYSELEFWSNTDTTNFHNMAKSIFDITKQAIGSMEFKIEVASACAESGMNYKDFAKLYNLNADELNAWALEFLGEGFE